MGAIENIADNAKARLLSRDDIDTGNIWTEDNIKIVSGDVPDWPRSDYGVRITVGAGRPGPGQIIRGTLSVEVMRRSESDDQGDQTVLARECLAAARKAHQALARSYLDGALDEGLEFQGLSRPRDITREQGGGGGMGVVAVLEYRYGVDWGSTHVPVGDAGTGIDQGVAS